LGQYGVALFITISGLYILPKSNNKIFSISYCSICKTLAALRNCGLFHYSGYFFGAYARKIPFFKGDIFLALGGLTYYIYLVHQQIGYMIMELFRGTRNHYIWGVLSLR